MFSDTLLILLLENDFISKFAVCDVIMTSVKSVRFFNYTNFLIFYTKMFWCFRYAYYLKKDSIHFGLDVSTQFGLKNQQYSQGHLDLYQFFMHNILYQNVS